MCQPILTSLILLIFRNRLSLHMARVIKVMKPLFQMPVGDGIAIINAPITGNGKLINLLNIYLHLLETGL